MSNYANAFLPEFDQEMASTRKLLERIPDDKLDWKAHPKLNSIGWNANHIADIPNWMALALTQTSLDIAPQGGPKYEFPALTSRAEILDLFDRNVAAARQALGAASDEDIEQPWSLLQGGQVFFTMPRSALLRGFGINHLVHHRAHLSAYLRMNDVPVPGMYGPSGDE